METANAEPISPSRVLRQLGSHASEKETTARDPYHCTYINIHLYILYGPKYRLY